VRSAPFEAYILPVLLILYFSQVDWGGEHHYIGLTAYRRCSCLLVKCGAHTHAHAPPVADRLPQVFLLAHQVWCTHTRARPTRCRPPAAGVPACRPHGTAGQAAHGHAALRGRRHPAPLHGLPRTPPVPGGAEGGDGAAGAWGWVEPYDSNAQN